MSNGSEPLCALSATLKGAGALARACHTRTAIQKLLAKGIDPTKLLHCNDTS